MVVCMLPYGAAEKKLHYIYPQIWQSLFSPLWPFPMSVFYGQKVKGRQQQKLSIHSYAIALPQSESL